MQTDGVVEILQSGFERLKEQNELTSLRSLALSLKLSSSYLSKVFRGERRLSPKLVAPLGKVLRLDHHEIKELQRRILGELETRKMATGVQTVREEQDAKLATDYESLGAKSFWLIEEWYHLPLLNLITVENVSFDARELAKRLGVAVERVQASIERMIRDGLIKRDHKNNLIRTEMKIRFPTQRSDSRIRAYHKKMIEKALKHLDKIPTEADFNERLISGVAFAADPKKIPQAKVLLEEAMYKAAELLTDGECSEVFQLNLQLFPLTKSNK